MSRIGRLPIPIPSGVDIAIDGQAVSVKGPKGVLSLTVAEPIMVAREDGDSPCSARTLPSSLGRVTLRTASSRTTEIGSATVRLS